VDDGIRAAYPAFTSKKKELQVIARLIVRRDLVAVAGRTARLSPHRKPRPGARYRRR
jgi:hypothetical protein